MYLAHLRFYLVFLDVAKNTRSAYTLSLVCKDARYWISKHHTLTIFNWIELSSHATEFVKNPARGRNVRHLWIGPPNLEHVNTFFTPSVSESDFDAPPAWEHSEWLAEVQAATTVILASCPNLLSLVLIPPLWTALTRGRGNRFRLLEFGTSTPSGTIAFPSFAPPLSYLRRIQFVADREGWWAGIQLHALLELRSVQIYWTNVPNTADTQKLINQTLDSSPIRHMVFMSSKSTPHKLRAIIDSDDRLQLVDTPAASTIAGSQCVLAEWLHRTRVAGFWL